LLLALSADVDGGAFASRAGSSTGGITIPGGAKNGSNRSFSPGGGGVGACGRIENVPSLASSPERESGGVGG